MSDELEHVEDVQEEVIETPEVVEDAPSEAEIEAKKYGWRPKDEYDRAPEGWVDAERFLELPSTNVKMLRDAKRELEQAREADKKEFSERIANIERVNREARDRALKQAEDRWKADMEQLAQQKREAAANHDLEAYDELSQREAQMRPPQFQQPQGPDPVIADYRAKNDWTNQPGMWAEATNIVGYAIQAGEVPAGQPQQQLEYAERAMKARFPHMFQEKQQNGSAPASRVDGGGLATSPRKSGKGWDDLPPEAKHAGAEYVEEGLFKSRDEYARSYFQENAK